MSDLISISEVNNVIDKLKVYTCGRPNTMKVEMCECRELKDYNSLLKTNCGYVFGMGKEFKYCPYCGKKIKVVE